MKKRGISPDTFTYSHMLAGFASQKECLPQFVTEAFKIYEHLKNNKNVRQDIIHTNGLLSVCMKANDMEKAWEILSKLPNVGPNAPNPTTYTVFLRGLRGMGEEAISDGKRAWNGVLSRWGKGDLIIDEYLANAYLDLLLSGESPENWREVFIAAHQIYDLPLPTKIRVARPDDSFYDRWLTPDDFTLGILLRAAEKLKDFSLAKQTWVAITKENFTIRPSPIATQLFLRCASICHAGADVVGILAGSTERLTEWNFVVAMKACVHSGGARGSMENARRVLESCENAKKIGLMVIRTYLLVALTTKDAGLIKHALLRIERHLTPKALKVITTNPHDLPRDQSETVTKFLFTLKKAVFWDRIMWGRHEEVQWVERLREVRKTLQTWDNQTEEEEAVVVADEAERLIIAKQAKSLLEAEKKKLDVVQSVEEVMAGLRKFSSKQRREFISSL